MAEKIKAVMQRCVTIDEAVEHIFDAGSTADVHYNINGIQHNHNKVIFNGALCLHMFNIGYSMLSLKVEEYSVAWFIGTSG